MMASPLKVGLAGLGTVGSAVLRLIEEGRDALTARCGRPIEVVAVSARDRRKDRGLDLGRLRWIDDPNALAADREIDVLVELIGGAGNPAKSVVETALAAGKSVVTANKALLAAHGVSLADQAERNEAALAFEAAAAGAIPIDKTMREGLVRNQENRDHGILNRT
jgi:homoserine dehydrogenase